MPEQEEMVIRRATAGDLDTINRIVESGVLGWNIAERVKRLSLASYHYTASDLEHLELQVVADRAGEILAVAAWEPAAAADLPAGHSGLLLHGLYVTPGRQGRGIGGHLLAAALDAAREQGMDGLLVKAQVDAAGFFAAEGFVCLPVADPRRDYPHRYWKAVY